MSWCTVKYCEINKKKNHKDFNVRFHRFPKNPVFENKWILACGKSSVNAKSVMTVYSILIVDREFTILYQKEWNQSGISSEEGAKLMNFMLFSVKTFVYTISPLDPNLDYDVCSNTGNYAIHYYDSKTGVRIVLSTDKIIQNIRDLLHKLYKEIYVEYVVKNTECEMGRPIESELFKLKLDQFIKEHL